MYRKTSTKFKFDFFLEHDRLEADDSTISNMAVLVEKKTASFELHSSLEDSRRKFVLSHIMKIVCKIWLADKDLFS